MAYEINININNISEVDENEVTEEKLIAKADSEVEKASKSLAGFIASQTIKPFVNNVKTNVSQNVGIVTGNTDLQQRINFGMELAQYGLSTLSNVQAGASIGGALGIGTGAGAVIGLSLSVLNTLIEMAFNEQRLKLEQRMENYQLEQTRSRAGVAFNKSRRGA